MNRPKKRRVLKETQELGIMCDKCGERMGVWKTEAMQDSIRRIRKCDDCEEYKVTYEESR